MTDEQLRIHGYLVAQGAKLAPAAAIEKVRAAMADLRAAADEVPSARFSERPEPEEWSANEVLAHVVAAGAHFGDAIVSALEKIMALHAGTHLAYLYLTSKSRGNLDEALIAMDKTMTAGV